ncbi:hypothetical protein PFISCL1PPCAC_973, partial [Pristionchus fissidentatus]
FAGQEFQCGTDKVQADIAKTVVQFNCKDKVSEINQCCGKHDGCYDEQQPRANCDATFCSCVQAASAGNPLCGFYTSLFCDTAKVFGEPAYRKVGERRGAERRAAAAAAAAAAATSTAAPTTTTAAAAAAKAEIRRAPAATSTTAAAPAATEAPTTAATAATTT